MSRFTDIRRFALPLIMVVVLTAIAVPTCAMVGCDMDMGPLGAMPFVPFNGPRAASTCGGEWVLNSTPAGTLPSGPDTLLLTFLAAFVAAVMVLAPQSASRPVLVRVSNPPPPPDDPLGERCRV
jgi:hypothetical protein